MDSLGLFMIGSATTLLIVAVVLPRFIEWVSHMVSGS